jgi:xylulokinase
VSVGVSAGVSAGVSIPVHDALVGVDLGTSVCKAFVFGPDLSVLGSAWRTLPLSALSGSEIEQDAEQWWSAACDTVREAVGKSGVRPECVRGISVAAQGISFVPVDGNCQPLRPAFSWMDTRARPERRRILDRFGEKTIFEVTGKRCLPSFLLPKLLWLKEHEPANFAKTRRILMPLDFLIARMTGQYVTDHSMASGTMLHDVNACDWSARILDAFDLDRAMLPELRWSGTPAGRLQPRAAEELGLTESAVVAVGGQDQKAAALGAGIGMERTTVSLGTAMAITQKAARPMVDARMRMPCYTDVMEGKWVIEGSGDCCNILDWLRHGFLLSAGNDEVDRMVDREGPVPNPVTFFPFFSGAGSPYFVSGARGFLHGLDLSASPGRIVRSIYEGVAYLIKHNIGVMEELSRPVRELRVFGGGSRSAAWCQIIADVTGVPVSVLGTSEAASLGAGMLAGVGCGVFGSLEDAFPLVSPTRSFPPRRDLVHAYGEAYRRYAEIRDRLLAPAGAEGDGNGE